MPGVDDTTLSYDVIHVVGRVQLQPGLCGVDFQDSSAGLVLQAVNWKQNHFVETKSKVLLIFVFNCF